MVIGFFKKAFKTAESGKQAAETGDSSVAAGGEADPQGFVEFVVKQLVDAPDEVTVATRNEKGQLLVEIRCAKADMGKVIGRGGKTIDAIRALAASAGKRIDQNVRVDVLD